MKIAIATVQVPFITGGAEVLANALAEQLRRRNHEVEIIALPFKWYPPERLLDCMLAARLTDLTEVNGTAIDRLIALKFPAYMIPHPRKSLWLLHQHRQAYDFFGTENSDLWQSQAGRAIAGEIKRWDDEFLADYPRRFTIARTVSNRLSRFNGLESTPLYPPLNSPGDYRCDSFEPYVFYPSRFDRVKRQHLLIDALLDAPSSLRVVLTGQTDSPYGRKLIARVQSDPRLRDRVSILGLVSEREKVDLYANCAVVYNGVYDEDYGYVTIEAFFSGKPVITHTDSGGPLEFVKHGESGWILPPHTDALSACLNEIAGAPGLLPTMGLAARRHIESIDLSWDRVISCLI